MIKKIFNLDYHPQLIEMMAKAAFAGAFSVNILAPILFSYAVFDYIESSYI